MTGVKPGIVLTSLTSRRRPRGGRSPPGPGLRSRAPRMPRPPAAAPRRRSRRAGRRGTSYSVPSSQVLGLEVVELVRRGPYLGDYARLRHAAGQRVAAPRTRSRGRGTRRPPRGPSGPTRARPRSPRRAPAGPRTLLMPMLDPARAGLTKTGQPSSRDPSRAPRPCPAPTRAAGPPCSRPTGSPAATKSFFMYSLSIATALGQHAGTDVGHAGELEQALQGAVLAVRRRAAAGTRRRPRRARAAPHPARASTSSRDGRVTGQHHAAPVSVHRRQPPVGDGQPLGRAGGQHPAALPGDPDRDDLVRSGRSRRARCRRSRTRSRARSCGRRTRRPPAACGVPDGRGVGLRAHRDRP